MSDFWLIQARGSYLDCVFFLSVSPSRKGRVRQSHRLLPYPHPHNCLDRGVQRGRAWCRWGWGCRSLSRRWAGFPSWTTPTLTPALPASSRRQRCMHHMCVFESTQKKTRPYCFWGNRKIIIQLRRLCFDWWWSEPQATGAVEKHWGPARKWCLGSLFSPLATVALWWLY